MKTKPREVRKVSIETVCDIEGTCWIKYGEFQQSGSLPVARWKRRQKTNKVSNYSYTFKVGTTWHNLG